MASSVVSTSINPKDESLPNEERQLGAYENYASFDVNFETTEIQDVIAFIEFKMNEITALVEECIQQEYANDITASVAKIKHECVGSTYQILFFNYNEGLKKIKDVLMEILKLKLQNLKEDYEDETNFFLDILESLVNKDYTIPKSLELAKKASKYYVSPRYFDRLVALTNPEVQAFTVLHERLKEQRTKIQGDLDAKEQNEESYINTIERKARQLDKRAAHSHVHKHSHKSHQRPRNIRQMMPDYQTQEYLQRDYTQQPDFKSRTGNQAFMPGMMPEKARRDQDKYLNNVASQLDGLGLYHNPALPADQESQQPGNNLFMPHQENEGDYRIKKV